MNYRIILDDSFEREVKHLSKRYPSLKADLGKLREELYANPQLGTDLGGGLRKIRMAITSKGRGKSGIYDKAERASISRKEIEELLRKNGLKG